MRLKYLHHQVSLPSGGFLPHQYLDSGWRRRHVILTFLMGGRFVGTHFKPADTSQVQLIGSLLTIKGTQGFSVQNLISRMPVETG